MMVLPIDAGLSAFLLRFALAGLATYRLTMFIVQDEGPLSIMLKIRIALGAFDWRDGSDNHEKWTGDFITCPYCVGQWIAMLALVAIVRPSFLTDLLLLWQAIAGMQAFMQTHTSRT